LNSVILFLYFTVFLLIASVAALNARESGQVSATIASSVLPKFVEESAACKSDVELSPSFGHTQSSGVTLPAFDASLLQTSSFGRELTPGSVLIALTNNHLTGGSSPQLMTSSLDLQKVCVMILHPFQFIHTNISII
jgi:hypothetical protein